MTQLAYNLQTILKASQPTITLKIVCRSRHIDYLHETLKASACIIVFNCVQVYWLHLAENNVLSLNDPYPAEPP